MLIVCQNCGTSYQIDGATLGPSGRSVRCTRCHHVWFTANTAALADIAKSHREELARSAGTTAVDAPVAPSGPSLATDSEVTPEGPPVQATGPVSSSEGEAPAPASDGDTAAIEPEPEPEPGLAPAAADFDPPRAEDGAIVEAPPLVPPIVARAEDIESVAARPTRRPAKRGRMQRPLPTITTAILMFVAFDVGLLAWRNEVVRWLPQTASLYAALRLPVNLRGLAFMDITTVTESQEGVPVVVIEGTIASVAPRSVEVPRLRFAVRNASGNEIYTWTALPTKSVLAPGETLPFRSRLASPPREMRDVVVRFFNRHDLVAGIQ